MSEYRKIQPREEQFCTFMLDQLLFGVEVLSVQEVLLKQRITRLPLVGSAVKGLINLRGQIVTAIDLRYRLGMDPPPPELEPMNMVVRPSGNPYALIVDQIGDVVNVNPETFEEPPETLIGSARELILGTYKLENRLLLVLDIERATALDNSISLEYQLNS